MSRPTVFTAAGLLTSYCAQRPKLLEAITDSLAGQPRAQSYDGAGSGEGPWCWAHGRSVWVCHDDGLFCSGEVVTCNDPTGNAAVSGDPASKHKAELERLESEVIDRVERIDTIRALYLPKTLPSGAERAKLATEGDSGCHWCWTQAKTWSPPMTKDPSTVAGNLKVAVLNCRGHYDWIRTNGRAPTPAETQGWVKTGKWPRQKAA